MRREGIIFCISPFSIQKILRERNPPHDNADYKRNEREIGAGENKKYDLRSIEPYRDKNRRERLARTLLAIILRDLGRQSDKYQGKRKNAYKDASEKERVHKFIKRNSSRAWRRVQDSNL